MKKTELSDVIRIISMTVYGLILSIKPDGRFPLPKSLSETAFQLLLLPYTFVLLGMVIIFLSADKLAKNISDWPFVQRLQSTPTLVLSLVVIAGFNILTLLIFIVQARTFAYHGYSLPHVALMIIAGSFLLGIAWVLLPGRLSPLHLLIIASCGFLTTQLVSIFCFPLNSSRSDMLPLIIAAGENFLSGHSAYGMYHIPHQVPLTYLPGTWIAYLPAIQLGLDPRFINIGLTLMGITLLYFLADPSRRARVAILGAIFMSTTLLHYRHEIYLAPLWLSLIVTGALLGRNRCLPASIALGWACATSQFAWVIAPAFVFSVWRRNGWRQALITMLISGGSAAMLILPFVFAAPQEFMHGVFGHWTNTVYSTTANLSYFIAQALTVRGLRIIQCVAWLGMVLVALRNRSVEFAPLTWMVFLLCAFVLFNSLIWAYFYLTILLLVVLAGSFDHIYERNKTT